jgi:hypothetical protein
MLWPATVIAALFVERDGIYWDIPDIDPWDEQRDARLYPGPHPVVAHPPCGRWCQLASVNEARGGAKIGDDGGCFESALNSVRSYGGVLEHPAYSLAWPQYNLPRPVRGYWSSDLTGEGWVTEVSQAAYGHPARKRTWLYANAPQLPSLDWSDPAGELVVGAGIHVGQAAGRGRIDGAAASATPEPFRDVLIEIARSVRA